MVSIFWLLPVTILWASAAWQFYRLGLVVGEKRATRLHTRKVDDMLSRWRSEQRP